METDKILYKWKKTPMRDVKKTLNISMGSLSNKLKDAVKPSKKVDNALIFAAGVGSRLRPLTNTTPKPLISVEGKVIIENTIELLHLNKIRDISIVVGHLAEKFDYLVEKYGVKLIKNDLYSKYNNIHSLYAARGELKNTLVVEGDVFLKMDSFSQYYPKGVMYSWKSDDFLNEWSFIKKGGQIVSSKKGAEKGESCWAGIYFLTSDQSSKIKEYFDNEYVVERDGSLFAEQLFWKIGLKFGDISINPKSMVEIDSLEDYYEANGTTFANIQNPVDAICIFTGVKEHEVKELKPIKGGLTNNTYSYLINDDKYIIRMTKEETNASINRYMEYDILQAIKSSNIGAECVFFSQETGIAIFKFIKFDSFFEQKNKEGIKSFSLALKKLHSLIVDGIDSWPAIEKIEVYEKMAKEHKKNIHKDLEKNKKRITGLINKYSKEKEVLCHNDLLPGNILVIKNDVKIIDWEYSSMNNSYWDIASWCLENDITKENLDVFQQFYGKVDVRKLNDYINIVSFMWSMWCYQQGPEWSQELKKYFENSLKGVNNDKY